MRKRRGIDGGEFFICFTSRQSSAAVGGGGSIRVPSSRSSLTSPGRSSSSVPSLTSSLSRRLRSSGSVKGSQSPMFQASAANGGRKKRGCAFDEAASAVPSSAAEPSSPKVTCIGQVRIKKSKKKQLLQQQQQQAMMMARSRSRDAGSFRRSRSQRGAERSQRWMHQLPLSICEALKSLGSEFSCFRAGAGGGGEKKIFSSCGAIVAVRKTEEDEEREKVNMGLFLRERELLEKKIHEGRGDEVEVAMVRKEMSMDAEEAENCIPPKNALLLMRCRSDPVRMAALANKFWGSPVVKIQCKEEEEEVDSKMDSDEEVRDPLEEKQLVDEEEEEEEEDVDEEMHEGVVVDAPNGFDEAKEEMEREHHVPDEEEGGVVLKQTHEKDLREETHCEVEGRRGSLNQNVDIAKAEEGAAKKRKEKKERRRHSFSVERESRRNSFSSEKEARRSSFSVDRYGRKRWSFSLEKEEMVPEPEPSTLVEEAYLEEKAVELVEPDKTIEETESLAAKVRDDVVEKDKGEEVQGGGRKREELPECLLLMMYEPKLSMEVSKETWVCSNDFMRWRPNYHPPPHQQQQPSSNGKVVAIEEESKDKHSESTDECREVSPIAPNSAIDHPTTPKPSPQPAPPSSVSCSAAGALPQAPYEPLALTRCKSAPLKSPARMSPDCFWESCHKSQDETLSFACRHGCCSSCAVQMKLGECRQPEALGISAKLQ